MRPAVDFAPVERLYEYLTQALERTRPDPYTAPVTVAEIYRELIPYRTVRAELGFSMNADYEHVLLRLLAGDAELALLEPAEAREQIRRELESTNPDVSLYRRFAGCDVWLRAPGAAAIVRPPVLELEEEVVEPVMAAAVPTAAPVRRVASGERPVRCVSCRAGLPVRPELRYCPYCGVEQVVQPCAHCGDNLDPGWAYCATCGSAA